MKQNLNNKKIELFVSNGIDNYRKEDTVQIGDLIKIYLDNDGFFVLKKDSSTEGYLDLMDLDQIKKIVEEIKNKKLKNDDTLRSAISKGFITLRKEFISSDEKLSEVIDKLNNSLQKYFPVVRDNVLIGRISKEIIRKKIDELY